MLKSLRSQTKELGSQLCHYTNKVCPEYKTKPLPREAAASYHHQAKGKNATSRPQQAQASNAKLKGLGVAKQFNLKTYKIHALGNYADNIK
jgi:hypothetical protein